MRLRPAVTDGVHRSRLLLAGCLLALCASVLGLLWSWRPKNGEVSDPPLPALGAIGPFVLTDQDGRAYTTEALLGHVTVVQVVLSQAVGASPTLLSRFTELDQNFRRSQRLRLVSVVADLDPANPPALRRLRQKYEGSERWTFATGGHEAVRGALRQLFQGAGVGSSDGNAQALVEAGAWCLVDDQSQVRARYAGVEPDAVARVLNDAGNLLRSGKKSGE